MAKVMMTEEDVLLSIEAAMRDYPGPETSRLAGAVSSWLSISSTKFPLEVLGVIAGDPLALLTHLHGLKEGRLTPSMRQPVTTMFVLSVSYCMYKEAFH
jgi:hypothetical protein